jgi:hypothetical protein
MVKKEPLLFLTPWMDGHDRHCVADRSSTCMIVVLAAFNLHVNGKGKKEKEKKRRRFFVSLYTLPSSLATTDH